MLLFHGVVNLQLFDNIIKIVHPKGIAELYIYIYIYI